jgi:uncharacterized protein YsxB (DUF464 family)
MTNVTFFRDASGSIKAFEVSGHCKSLVCAAISSLVINFVNYVEEHITSMFKLSRNDNKDGYIYFKVTDNNINDKLSILLEYLYYSLSSIAKEHSRDIKICNQEE